MLRPAMTPLSNRSEDDTKSSDESRESQEFVNSPQHDVQDHLGLFHPLPTQHEYLLRTNQAHLGEQPGR